MVRRFKPLSVNVGKKNSSDPYDQDARKQFAFIEKEFERFVGHVEAEAAGLLESWLEFVFEKSQELVPFDTGDLKNSGYIDIRMTAKGPRGEIGYAKNGFPDYAVVVHEDTTKYHEPPTQAKFLQQPVEEYTSFFEETMAEGLRVASGL